MRIKIIVSYDGTDFCGWQRQKKGERTVQETLEKAVFEATGENTEVVASGRTDSGVHAEGQVCHFDLTNDVLPVDKMFLILNTKLPKDVSVISSELADDNFNARFSAKRKTYIYRMYKSRSLLPLKDRYAERIDVNCDFDKMKKCAALFKGEHDFKSFCRSDYSSNTTVRKIYSVNLREKNGFIEIAVTGNGFLYNMVRNIAGCILSAGEGKTSESDIKYALENYTKKNIGKTLSGKGLTLFRVEYASVIKK